jgi:hypothetical protein
MALILLGSLARSKRSGAGTIVFVAGLGVSPESAPLRASTLRGV